jgi:hypothetical protein
MTTTIIAVNAVAAAVILAALAAVCRLGHLVASERADTPAEKVRLPPRESELERAA